MRWEDYNRRNLPHNSAASPVKPYRKREAERVAGRGDARALGVFSSNNVDRNRHHGPFRVDAFPALARIEGGESLTTGQVLRARNHNSKNRRAFLRWLLGSPLLACARPSNSGCLPWPRESENQFEVFEGVGKA